MNNSKGFSKLWFLVLLLVTFVAGCASHDDPPPKAFTAYSLGGVAGTINETAKTISVTMPYSTDVRPLVATFTTTGAGVNVGTVAQTSGSTVNNFTAPVAYTVSATDSTTVTYSVTVTIAPNSAKGITAYSLAGAAGIINESNRIIAVTVPFGTNVANLAATFTTTGEGVTVGPAVQVSGTTANNFAAPVTCTVTAADNSTATYTVNVTVASNPAKGITAFSFVGFTGFAGTINEPAKSIAVNLPFGTNVSNLAATFTTTGTGVKIGSTVQASGVTTNNFTAAASYTVTAADSSTAIYIVTVTITPNPAKTIGAFSFAGFTGAAGVVDESAKTIAVTVPFGTNVTALVATFTSTGPAVKVGTAVQTSTATANNFTTPVAYIVTAADNSTVTYTVNVTVAPNPAKAISAYSFVGFTGFAGTVDETAKTIAVTVPFGTDVKTLVAAYTTTGAGVKVGTAVQTSTATANDFTTPVAYTVTADDKSTSIYTVTVTIAPNPAKGHYRIFVCGAGAAGVVDEAARTIAVNLPFGTDVTTLIATFTTTGTDVKVGSTVQTSTTTINNFTAPVAYIVTAADGTTATYSVTVTAALNSAKAISAYSLAGSTGTINESAKTIAVNLPIGTNVTALAATFTTTGAGAKVGTVAQISTATLNDFTNPVAYIVTAADGTTINYTVTVTMSAAKGPAPVLLGTAGNFVILATSAVSTVPASVITGDVGVSPSATSFLTGFSLTLVGTVSATSTQVTGNLYGADMSPPTSSNLTTAVGDMGAAYSDAAGRPTPDFLNLGAGEIGGQTLIAGLYNWTTGVTVSSDVTLSGGPNDIWIFQIPGNLSISPAKKVLLSGGAQAKNIFWQVAGAASVGTTAHFEGIILSKTAITLGTGASINGRLLAQTAVDLDTSTVTAP